MIIEHQNENLFYGVIIFVKDHFVSVFLSVHLNFTFRAHLRLIFLVVIILYVYTHVYDTEESNDQNVYLVHTTNKYVIFVVSCSNEVHVVYMGHIGLCN